MDRTPVLLPPPATSAAVRTEAGSPLAPPAIPFPAPAPAAAPGVSLSASWTPSAQVAAVALILLATVLLGVNAWGQLRFGARPTEWDSDRGLDYRVDLNRAGRAELLQLPGIGPTLAERIEHYRITHGGFRSIEELRRVSGIGPARLERLRPWLCMGQESEEDSEPAVSQRPQPQPSPVKNRRLPSPREAALKGVRINVNCASQEQLRRLPRIGPKLSQRILEERARRPFATVEDLRRVPGIGPKTLDLLRPYVAVSGAAVQVGKPE